MSFNSPLNSLSTMAAKAGLPTEASSIGVFSPHKAVALSLLGCAGEVE